jgi:hypothetical protein
MTQATKSGAPSAWDIIENEKRRDALIRRACIVAWSVTFGMVLLLAAVLSPAAVQMVRGAMSGDLPWITAAGTLFPLIDVLWKLSLLVATLTTVGVFLRLRSASLADIQLRLAALEQMIGSQSREPN